MALWHKKVGGLCSIWSNRDLLDVTYPHKLVYVYNVSQNLPYFGIIWYLLAPMLDLQFPGHMIGRCGSQVWPPRSPNLTPLDLYLWAHLKAKVYRVKIQNVGHLNDGIIDECAHINTRFVKLSSP